MLQFKKIDNLLLITFESDKPTNPFSKYLSDAVITALNRAEKDSEISAVILSGGVGRSFSAGGDFREVSKLDDAEAVDSWISNVMELYITTLKLSKPCIAAIDGHAVGIGFQLALMCDVRIGTEESVFIMPELKGGIVCTIGTYLLENFFGRGRMQEIVFGSDPIPVKKALEWGVLHEVCTKDQLMDKALQWAGKLSDYPTLSFRYTKKFMNKGLIQGLENITPETTMAHTIAIEGKSGQDHYEFILNKNKA